MGTVVTTVQLLSTDITRIWVDGVEYQLTGRDRVTEPGFYRIAFYLGDQFAEAQERVPSPPGVQEDTGAEG